MRIARDLLADSLPRRWNHTRGVATRAKSLSRIMADQSDLLEAAAWLHDIGYSPDVRSTGFHPLDGATYLRDVHAADPILCRLVAHHSCAAFEASERGLECRLREDFPLPPDSLADALTFCDMTTSPNGQLVLFEERLAEIRSRYGESHLVTRSIQRATPSLTRAVDSVADRLAKPRVFSQSRCGTSDAAR